jgi:hypothetical protein
VEAGQDRVAWLRSILFAGDETSGTAATHRVAPSTAAPRFVVPIADRRVAAASVLAYNRLRPPRVAAARAVIGTALRTGTGALVLREEVDLSGSGRPDDDLVAHLAAVLGHDRLYFAAGFGGAGPFTKPTLQLFDVDARPVGYAKIGWNEPTRELVEREAAALDDGMLRAAVRMPGLLAAGAWRDRAYVVTTPLPARVRRVPHRRYPCAGEAAAIAAAGSVPEQALDAWPVVVDARGAAVDLGDDVGRVVERLDRYGDVVLPVGHAHGDWVPWNIAIDADGIIVWDWEHHTRGAPSGFDLAHWAYQRWAVLKRLPSEAAAAAGAVDAGPQLTALGLSSREAGAVCAAHHATLAVREARAARVLAAAA